MNLGCLLPEAGQAPRNLKHFVVDNEVYQTCPDPFICVHYWQMSQTITIRLTSELAAWLEEMSARSGVPRGRIIREQLERARASHSEHSFMKLAGTVRGPRDLSRRKGFSRSSHHNRSGRFQYLSPQQAGSDIAALPADSLIRAVDWMRIRLESTAITVVGGRVVHEEVRSEVSSA